MFASRPFNSDVHAAPQVAFGVCAISTKTTTIKG